MNDWSGKLIREPLLHFLAVEFVLFIAGEIHRRHVDESRIVVTPQREALLATRYALQFGEPPDAQTLAQLIERDIEEQMLFRRGLALDLDKDVYYARVLEIPTPRWGTLLAVENGLPIPPEVPATIQERAWSSPIWFDPQTSGPTSSRAALLR